MKKHPTQIINTSAFPKEKNQKRLYFILEQKSFICVWSWGRPQEQTLPQTQTAVFRIPKTVLNSNTNCKLGGPQDHLQV